jgi:hypothetical protein
MKSDMRLTQIQFSESRKLRGRTLRGFHLEIANLIRVTLVESYRSSSFSKLAAVLLASVCAATVQPWLRARCYGPSRFYEGVNFFVA